MAEKVTTEQLLDVIANLQKQVETLQADRHAGTEAVRVLAERSAPAENPNYNEIGPFTHPEGERVRPKARLSRPTFFGGVRQREDDLTPFEIDAFNAIVNTRTARNGTWVAEVRQQGAQQELWVEFPQRTLDERMNLPPCALMLLELAEGARAADPVDMAKELAALRQMVAALQ